MMSPAPFPFTPLAEMSGFTAPQRPERILVVEDSPTVLLQTRVLLAKEGFQVATANDGTTGVEQVRQFRPHCVLLDYHLPDMTGEEAVSAIRQFDPRVQIVLVTARAEDHPPRDTLRQLDIQGYHDKADGMERLLVWIEAALKAHARSMVIEHQAAALRHVVSAGQTIHRIQPLDELLKNALDQMLTLVAGPWQRAGAGGVVVAWDPEGHPRRVAASGRELFASREATATLFAELSQVREVTRRGSRVLVPVRVTDHLSAGFVLEVDGELGVAADYLSLLASQVALSIANIRLFEMATVDPVTGLMSRAYLMQRLIEWLKLVVRGEQALSLIFIDMDRLKPINDVHGHIVGDQVLAELGRRLGACVRDVDCVGRLGGDEFLVVLPSATPSVGVRIARRLCRSICTEPVVVGALEIELSASLGAGGVSRLPSRPWMRDRSRESAWNRLALRFIELVDTACYEAKGEGGGRVAIARADGSDDLYALLTQTEDDAPGS